MQVSATIWQSFLSGRLLDKFILNWRAFLCRSLSHLPVPHPSVIFFLSSIMCSPHPVPSRPVDVNKHLLVKALKKMSATTSPAVVRKKGGGVEVATPKTNARQGRLASSQPTVLSFEARLKQEKAKWQREHKVMPESILPVICTKSSCTLQSLLSSRHLCLTISVDTINLSICCHLSFVLLQ